ncbi:MAG: hypothetical protein LBP19_01365 [Treponema sp.]|nr:hypothetical protein [Treponema sp.]
MGIVSILMTRRRRRVHLARFLCFAGTEDALLNARPSPWRFGSLHGRRIPSTRERGVWKRTAAWMTCPPFSDFLGLFRIPALLSSLLFA